jgi:hypothetical protein
MLPIKHILIDVLAAGLPPHARGRRPTAAQDGATPAHTGTTTPDLLDPTREPSYPRVCGDDPCAEGAPIHKRERPRGRGDDVSWLSS